MGTFIKGNSSVPSVPKAADGARQAKDMKEYLYVFFTTFVLGEKREKAEQIIAVGPGSGRCKLLYIIFTPDSLMVLLQRVRSRF